MKTGSELENINSTGLNRLSTTYPGTSSSLLPQGIERFGTGVPPNFLKTFEIVR